MNRTIALLVLMTVGCKAPVEAPEDLGEASRYLFANFDSETGDELIAGMVTLEAYLASIEALDGNINDRAVTPPLLTPAYWGTVSGPEGSDPQVQIPVAISGVSRHDLAAHVELVGEENYVCVESDTTKYAHREFLTDLTCFLDGSCDTVSTVQETRKESLIGDVWYDWYKDYRMVELDDGRQVMFGRGWQEDVYFTDNGNGSWDQSYALDVWVTDPGDAGQVHRFTSLWSSVTLGGVGDDAWASLVKNGLDEANSNTDDFIDGDMCGNDRERENDRPTE